MINLFPHKISFTASSTNCARTKQNKDRDYASINNQMRKYALVNQELERQISFLEQEISSMVSYYQNSDTAERVDIEKKIETKKQLIEDLQKQIETNRASSSALWYGYHERL